MRLVAMIIAAILSVDARTFKQRCLLTQRSKHGHPLGAVIPIKVFAFDFDNTATPSTAKPSSVIVYKATKKYQNGDRMARRNLDKEWNSFSSVINQRVEDLVEETLRSLTDSAEPLDMDLVEFLTKLDHIFAEKAHHVIRTKMLKGINANGLHVLSCLYKLMPGTLNVLNCLRNQPVHVISAGWSTRLIRSVFKKHEASTNLIIHSAEMPFKKEESTGDITKLLSSFGKERVLGKLIEEATNRNGYSIYVGDDFVDLLAMLKADIGIAINYKKTFLHLVHAFGIRTVPVTYWRRRQDCWHKNNNATQKPVIYTAQSWGDIGKLILGPAFKSCGH